MNKKITFLFLIIFLLNSCADTFSSVKRGLTGAKSKTTEEFLVEKKDPLILPPNFDELPLPDADAVTEIEVSSFEETLTENMPDQDISTTSNTAESSILEQIKKN
tara:strand:+ start:208 stop:522 length:315 start_codon:yes stop_codon:yes gene_type:complete